MAESVAVPDGWYALDVDGKTVYIDDAPKEGRMMKFGVNTRMTRSGSICDRQIVFVGRGGQWVREEV